MAGAGLLASAALAYAAGRIAGAWGAQYRRGYEAGAQAQAAADTAAQLKVAEAAREKEEARGKRADLARADSERRLADLRRQLSDARKDALSDPDYARCDSVPLPAGMHLPPADGHADGDRADAPAVAGGPDV